jgi:hypothetical protein
MLLLLFLDLQLLVLRLLPSPLLLRCLLLLLQLLLLCLALLLQDVAVLQLRLHQPVVMLAVVATEQSSHTGPHTHLVLLQCCLVVGLAGC